MKILIAASNMVHINNFHRPYIEELKKAGHDVFVMAKGEGADFDIPFVKRSLSFSNFKLSYKIRDILKKEEFESFDFGSDSKKVDYGKLYQNRNKMLKIA